ncbi:hypothetical protein IAU60_006813 [Kwoniella sp. DSM 27419]
MSQPAQKSTSGSNEDKRASTGSAGSTGSDPFEYDKWLRDQDKKPSSSATASSKAVGSTAAGGAQTTGTDEQWRKAHMGIDEAYANWQAERSTKDPEEKP